MRTSVSILSFLLACIIICSSLRISFTYAYYIVDAAGFIERLCENKDKPELQCNGKCHLKKMVENNTNDDKAPIKDINFKEITLFVVEQESYNLISVKLIKTEIKNYNNLYKYSLNNTLDHPPQA